MLFLGLLIRLGGPSLQGEEQPGEGGFKKAPLCWGCACEECVILPLAQDPWMWPQPLVSRAERCRA